MGGQAGEAELQAEPCETTAGSPAGGSPASRSGQSGGSEGEGPGRNRVGDEDEEEQDVDGEGADDGESAVGGDEEWEEMLACPLMVRFTQERIHPFFYRRGPIVNVVPRIRPVLVPDADDETVETVELVAPFGPIHCLRKGDELWSLDNRRLYALQLAAMEHWPRRCRVRLLCRDQLPRQKFKTQWRKLNTTSEGRAIDVCTRFQQFDTWSWFDRAVELEWYDFSQVLGVLLSCFELLPVLGALLFRTGLTGFSSRVPLVIAFVLAFLVDFARQKVPAIERRVCELHVVAVMEGGARQRMLWDRWKQQGQSGAQPSGTSAPQLAAIVGLALALSLPYLCGLSHRKVRSSLLSCWLGVACVLAVQLGGILRTSTNICSEYTGSSRQLTPKHRD